MRKLLLALLLIFIACSEQERLLPIVGESCIIVDNEMYVGLEAERLVVGECRVGVTYFEDENSIACRGYGNPSPEICDGRDNDCNGFIDDQLTFNHDHEQNICKDVDACGLCKYTYTVCRDGQVRCRNINQVGEEICDGFDNDCNCITDDVPPEESLQDIHFGGASMCSVGIKKCESGTELFEGLQTPIREICGNGRDDDCDGITDELEELVEGQAFAVVVDISGSMNMYRESVKDAICEWASLDKFSKSKFAIVLVGDGDGWQNGYYSTVLIDFSDPEDVCLILTNHEYVPSGDEFPVQATLGFHNEFSELKLTWPKKMSKRVIAFSDERPQVKWNSSTVELLEFLTDDCRENDYTFSIFTSYLEQSSWQPFASGCDGFVEVLNPVPQFMREVINLRFGGECK